MKSWCWVSQYNYHAKLIVRASPGTYSVTTSTHYQDLFIHHLSGCRTAMECAFGCLKKKPFFAIKLVSDPPLFALNYLAVVFSPVFARQRRSIGRKLVVRSQAGTLLPMRTRKSPLGGVLSTRISGLCLLCLDLMCLLLFELIQCVKSLQIWQVHLTNVR